MFMHVSFKEKPFIRFSLTFNYASVVTMLGILYLLWEIYWTKQVGYAFIKWHTHVALYFYLWLLLWFILGLLNRLFGLKRYEKYQMAVASVCFTLLLLEIVLLATGTGDTYMEKIKFGYASRYNAAYEKYYRTHEPYEKFYIIRPEFNYVRQCNSLGFSDMEWRKEKSKNEKRVLLCGDSFTEGVGAPYDSCYVSLLSKLLLTKDTGCYFMNAGISGDDPCVNFVNYRDRLVSYHPDIIIQTLSSNDINTDMAAKGGLERFQKNETIKLPPPPWWEPIYALSYVSRTFLTALGYNELLLKTPFPREEVNKLDQLTTALFLIYAKEAKRNGAKLLVVLQPNQSEIYKKQYDYNLDKIITNLHTIDNVYVFDLLPFYLKEFGKSKDDIRNYYWKQDGHHNSKGYVVMAKGVYSGLQKFYPEIFPILDSQKTKPE